jgi:hypothetical protein
MGDGMMNHLKGWRLPIHTAAVAIDDVLRESEDAYFESDSGGPEHEDGKDDETDNENVATDVSEDLDRSMGHREIDDPPDGDVFNFTGVPSGTDLRASLGLNEQKLARAFNEQDPGSQILARI